jgi:hypothetical protein
MTMNVLSGGAVVGRIYKDLAGAVRSSIRSAWRSMPPLRPQGIALARSALAAWDMRAGRLVRPFPFALKVPYGYWTFEIAKLHQLCSLWQSNGGHLLLLATDPE